MSYYGIGDCIYNYVDRGETYISICHEYTDEHSHRAIAGLAAFKLRFVHSWLSALLFQSGFILSKAKKHLPRIHE